MCPIFLGCSHRILDIDPVKLDIAQNSQQDWTAANAIWNLAGRFGNVPTGELQIIKLWHVQQSSTETQ